MKIERAELSNGQSMDFGDFNVLIGGNGVGKTTLMSELYTHSTNRPRTRYRWIRDVRYSTPDLVQDMAQLQKSLQKNYDGGNIFYVSSATKDPNGNPENDPNGRFAATEIADVLVSQPDAIFQNFKYRRPFIAYSSCDARLGLANEVGRTNLKLAPQDPINVLHRERRIQKAIDATLFERFGIHFVILDHSGTNLELGIARTQPPLFDHGADDLQAEFSRIDEWKGLNFDVLSEAGHGIRSMIRLLTTLLDPVNTVIMIDEPEMHLYPSHKRWLGRELVRFAREQAKQVFLVTHDPIILQGILDSNTTTSILRVERNPISLGTVKACSLESLKDATATRNQEQYLQGLFYQRCIIVEGASDRSFYQRILETDTSLSDQDIGFVACGGKGGTVNMAFLSSRIGLRAAFIYDLDAIIFEPWVVRNVYELLGGAGDPLKALWDALGAGSETVRSNIHKADPESIKSRNAAIKELTGYSPKYGMQSEWGKRNQGAVDATLAALARLGIFVVPLGELESWAPSVAKGTRFAELGPEALRSEPERLTQVQQFLAQVLGFLA